MGTRCLTVIKDDDGSEIAVMYRHWDGGLASHGKELVKFLKPMRLIDGISDDNEKNVANGMNDLAAQVICHFKKKKGHRVGKIYLYTPETRDVGEEFIYEVYYCDGKINLKIFREWDKAVLYNDDVKKLSLSELTKLEKLA